MESMGPLTVTPSGTRFKRTPTAQGWKHPAMSRVADVRPRASKPRNMFMGDARCRCREELSLHRRECTDSMPTRCLIAAFARLRKQEGLNFVFDTCHARTCKPAGDLSEAEANVILGAGLA